MRAGLQQFPPGKRLRVVKIPGAVAALAMLTVALSACSGGAEPATVAGVAAPCGGPVVTGSGLAGWVLQPVHVRAILGGHTVASETVSYRKDRDRYRLSLPPGKYAIASTSEPHGVAVTLRAGQRMTLNLPDLCS